MNTLDRIEQNISNNGALRVIKTPDDGIALGEINIILAVTRVYFMAKQGADNVVLSSRENATHSFIEAIAIIAAPEGQPGLADAKLALAGELWSIETGQSMSVSDGWYLHAFTFEFEEEDNGEAAAAGADWHEEDIGMYITEVSEKIAACQQPDKIDNESLTATVAAIVEKLCPFDAYRKIVHDDITSRLSEYRNKDRIQADEIVWPFAAGFDDAVHILTVKNGEVHIIPMPVFATMTEARTVALAAIADALSQRESAGDKRPPVTAEKVRDIVRAEIDKFNDRLTIDIKNLTGIIGSGDSRYLGTDEMGRGGMHPLPEIPSEPDTRERDADKQIFYVGRGGGGGGSGGGKTYETQHGQIIVADDYIYVIFGVDDKWDVERYDSDQNLTSHTATEGAKPTLLAGVEGLAYD